MIILVCVINAGRALGEEYETEPDAEMKETKLDGVSLCILEENFLDQEPCWKDYLSISKKQVETMKDVYRYSELLGASSAGEKLKINGKEFNNPMFELSKE